MNKQSLNKLSLFLTGMEQRLIDNWEFFKGITAVFKSGTREFPAKVWQDGNKLKMNFSGSTETLESNWLCARIAKIAQNYDSVVINYEERGTTIIIEADDKNVRMKTQEAKEQKEAIIAHSETSHISNRDYYIKVGQADELLREIRILGSNGKIKNDMIRKYNQIDHFVELIYWHSFLQAVQLKTIMKLLLFPGKKVRAPEEHLLNFLELKKRMQMGIR